MSYVTFFMQPKTGSANLLYMYNMGSKPQGLTIKSLKLAQFLQNMAKVVYIL